MQVNSMSKESLKDYFCNYPAKRSIYSSIVELNQSVYYLSFKKMYVCMRFTHVYGGHNA
jgi:hypothetical protein